MPPVTVRVLHGTGNVGSLTSFDPAFAGNGEDQMGSGFYFTDLERTAWGYTMRRNAHDDPKPGGEDDPGVVVAEVVLHNPIVVPAGTVWGDAFEVTPEVAERIVLRTPDLLDRDYGPLTDWEDVSGYSDDEMRALARSVVRRLGGTSLQLIENDWFKGAEASATFREAVRDVTGHDGVVADHGEETHYVAWFPDQVRVLEILRSVPGPSGPSP